MRGSKLILLLSLLLAPKAFGLTATEQITNIVYNVVYSGPSNLPPRVAERHWNFSKLTNMGSAATFRALRTAGFTPVGASDSLFLVASNAYCVTNIPGIDGSGLFMHQFGTISNAGTIYLTFTNRSTVVDSQTDLIQSVRVMVSYVTNEATISNPGLGQRALNISSSTNNTMNNGDTFNLAGNNFHFTYLVNTIGLSVQSNANVNPYTAEDYLGRTWVNPKMVGSPGGALDNFASSGFALQNAQHGTRWELGWEFRSETCVRVWAGPNEAIRTLDGFTQWQPMRSFWVEDVNSGSGNTTNRSISVVIHSISVYYHKTGSWANGLYAETNNANPYGALSFRGNVVTANSGSFNDVSVVNSPTNSTNVVNLAALQNSLRTNGAVGSVTQTNFNLLQIYTNSSGLVQAYSGSIGLTPAAVVGNVGIVAFLSRDNGATFSSVSRVSEGTAIGITVAPTTNGYFFALNTNDQCYFTNISSGIGNSAGLVPGSGQVTLMGASISTTITNAVTIQYVNGLAQTNPFASIFGTKPFTGIPGCWSNTLGGKVQLRVGLFLEAESGQRPRVLLTNLNNIDCDVSSIQIPGDPQDLEATVSIIVGTNQTAMLTNVTGDGISQVKWSSVRLVP